MMTLGSYLWNCLRSQEHRVLSHHLLSLRTHPSGENQEPPTHKRKGCSRNATSEPYSLPLGPVRGSQFRSGIQMLSTKHVSCSALWPREKGALSLAEASWPGRDAVPTTSPDPWQTTRMGLEHHCSCRQDSPLPTLR